MSRMADPEGAARMALELAGDRDAELEEALEGFTADLDSHPIQGFLPGGVALDVPLASRITGNLWVGGWPGPILTSKFASKIRPLTMFAGIVDVYGEPYPLPVGPVYVRKPLQDWAGEPDARTVVTLAMVVNLLLMNGPVLVHCQAGINRSSLIAAAALTLSAAETSIDDAIALIREKRSPLCLSNDAFERWLQTKFRV